MKKVIISLLAAVFLFGCTNPGGNGTKNPGKFSATVLSDAMGSSARGIPLGTYTVANSKNIYFILRNVGDFPITNIALTPGKLNKDGGAFAPITDGGITASPSGITVLETSGKASEEGAALDISLDADIETLIKVCSFELRYSEDNGATYKKAEYDVN